MDTQPCRFRPDDKQNPLNTEENQKIAQMFLDLVKKVPGVTWVEMSYGWDPEDPEIWIHFTTHDINKLSVLLYWLDPCHKGGEWWRTEVRTDCAYKHPTFCIVSPFGGQSAFDDLNKITSLLEDDDVENFEGD